jgi:hypothetical protein
LYVILGEPFGSVLSSHAGGDAGFPIGLQEHLEPAAGKRDNYSAQLLCGVQPGFRWMLLKREFFIIVISMTYLKTSG